MLHLLPLVLLFSACQPPPAPVPGELERTGEVVSVVNGQNITQSMVDATLAQLPANVRDQVVARGQQSKIKEQLVIGELLYQEALKQKLNEKPDVKTAIALAERNALANALLEDVIKQRTTDDAVKAWYNDHLVQFSHPQVKARHILIAVKTDPKKDPKAADAEKAAAKKKAEDLLAQIKGGADFAKVATDNSMDPGSAKDGGELGWFEQNRMVKEFADAAFAANKGDVIGPVETKYGFHIIQVEDKRDAIPVEEAADKIKSQLRDEVVQKYIDEIKKGATITEPGGSSSSATVAPALQTDSNKPAAAPGGASTPAPASAPPAPH